jgi:threonine dehydratase
VLTTPLLPHEGLSNQLGFALGFKAENLQHIGAFKTRGAINAVMSLSQQAANCGVVTHSSGNHAAALARAARIRQIPAYIVMPHNSARIKIESVRSFGCEPHFCEPSAPARAAAADELQRQTGARLVHPYDDIVVIAGQGTVGLEILDQWPEVDVVLAPVGGGGLMSGLLLSLKLQRPDVQVIAVEPEQADDAARSLRSGKIEQPTRYDTIADGLRTCLGQITFPILQQYLDEIVLVSDREILQATRMLSEVVHLVVEPSGAVSFAGAMKLAKQLQGKRVCTVLSGGNIDFGSCQLGYSTPNKPAGEIISPPI